MDKSTNKRYEVTNDLKNSLEDMILTVCPKSFETNSHF